jgi:hypothetical protein
MFLTKHQFKLASTSQLINFTATPNELSIDEYTRNASPSRYLGKIVLHIGGIIALVELHDGNFIRRQNGG